VSYYANFNYSYREKYSIYASARKDESNIFGVKANQKGVPLWSVGAKWDVSKEDFYKFNLLPSSAFRFSYGYSGNVVKSLSAYTTARVFSGTNTFGQVLQEIVNPPNPSLSWEKIGILNLGWDFAFKND